MDLQEAQAFFLQYNGLEFHMFHDDPRRYRAFQALSIPRPPWRNGGSSSSRSTSPIWRPRRAGAPFRWPSSACWKCSPRAPLPSRPTAAPPDPAALRRRGAGEAQKLRVLELMAGREGDGHDGGVWLVCTRSGLAPELGRALEQLGGFPCSWAEMDRYQRALQKIRRILAGFVSPAPEHRQRPGGP